MPKWEPADRVSVFSIRGGWQPSRAVNPSAGDDPVSLGLLGSGTPAPVPAIPRSQLPPPAPPPEPAHNAAGPFEGPPGEAPSPIQSGPTGSYPNLVLLDEGMVSLNGRRFLVSPEIRQALMALLLEGYEAALKDEIDQLRMSVGLYTPAPEGEALSPEGVPAWLVREMQREGPPDQPAEPGQAPAQDLQSLPEGAPVQPAVPTVSRRKARKRTATPPARPPVPLGDDAAEEQPD